MADNRETSMLTVRFVSSTTPDWLNALLHVGRSNCFCRNPNRVSKVGKGHLGSVLRSYCGDENFTRTFPRSCISPVSWFHSTSSAVMVRTRV